MLSPHHHWSGSVKHLAAENVMVNDLSKRPVTNLPIMPVPTWRTAPSLYLSCAILLLRFCMLAVWKKLFHELLRSINDFNLTYYPIISCRGNVQLVAWLSGRTSVFGWRTFSVLRLTCSWRVTTYVGKPSAMGQPTRPTQPFIPSGLPERFEIYIVYKRRYINMLPFLSFLGKHFVRESETCWQPFLPNVNLRLRSLYAIAILSVCRLSVCRLWRWCALLSLLKFSTIFFHQTIAQGL